MTTAAIYARLSDDKSGDAVGVANQLAACREFLQRKEWTEGIVYIDNDISATTGAVRPEFEQMLIDAPAVVVAFKQDRLTRSSMDTLRIKTAGITGYLTDGGMLDFSTADAGMLTMIRSAIDEAEGRKKAERQKLASLASFRAGKWHYSRPQFGNDWKTGELIPKEAEAIREAAKEIAAGRSTFFQTSKIWNAAGFRTPSTTKGHGGRAWEPGTVRTFFLSERLIGKRTYAGETRTMEGWKPILDEDTFRQIQVQIESKRTGKPGVQGSRRNPHLLTGIAVCGVDNCGKGLNAGQRGGAGSVRLYKCTVPGHVVRKAETLERFVVENFLYLLMHSGAEKLINPEGHTSSAPLRAQRTQMEVSHREWLVEAVEADLRPSIIQQKEVAYVEKLAALDAQLLEAVKDAVFKDLLPELAAAGPEALWDRWETVPMPQKREIVQALYKEISVGRASRSHKFDTGSVRLRATPLMLELVDLNQPEVYLDNPQVIKTTVHILRPKKE